eukprot:CAMPEP_0178993272 /NCGR_PEP_ID=MMETSP0795-20121207/6612_1 /TAXON_ID=88552 /ORGANISM="Amoebophrya sp., Strain Ameob2" /LENGTH=378 /DNA_ID=CAMNT_0020685315 /DNA_START=84 /DNA_END=1220 /DNA_ORIENTATION=-
MKAATTSSSEEELLVLEFAKKMKRSSLEAANTNASEGFPANSRAGKRQRTGAQAGKQNEVENADDPPEDSDENLVFGGARSGKTPTPAAGGSSSSSSGNDNNADEQQLPFYEKRDYLDRLTESQRVFRKKRANFTYREPEFVAESELADLKESGDTLTNLRAALLLSPRAAKKRGLLKITGNNGRTGKQDLIAQVLSRWWYCLPECDYAAEEQEVESGLRLNEAGLRRLSLEEFYEQVVVPSGEGGAEKGDAGKTSPKAAKRAAGTKSKKKKAAADPAKTAEERKKLVYEMGQFPGVFKNFAGETWDFRKLPRVTYNFLEKKPEAELRKLLATGIDNQIAALKQKMVAANTWSFPGDTELLDELERKKKEIAQRNRKK